MLIIYAINIHVGGARVLLEELLRAATGLNIDCLVFIDKRFKFTSQLTKNIKFIPIKPSIINRIFAEFQLYKNAKKDDVVLCFGNLPPIFNLKSFVSVYIQQAFLLNKMPLNKFSLKTRLRINMERFWLFLFSRNAHEFIVQSQSMKTSLIEFNFAKNKPIHLQPFIETETSSLFEKENINVGNNKKEFDLIFVASGEPYKNHINLIKAWCLLAEEGIYLSLCLTIDEKIYSDLFKWIELKRDEYKLNLFNFPSLTKSQINDLYLKSKTLIFPSLVESFGLPLIEAKQAGLSIIASELDFVRDILNPDHTFDPNSPVSIARAVKRSLNNFDSAFELIDSKDLIRSLINKKV